MISIFLPLLVVLGAGLVELSSISVHLFSLQLLWMLIGSGFVAAFFFIDWHTILNYRWLIWGMYVLAILMLIFTAATSPVIRNTKSWIVVGPLTFQPVELAKVALILVYALYFSRRHLAVARVKNILTSFALFALPAGLTMLQPDLGSTLVLFGIWFGFLLVSGLPRRRIIAALLAFLLIGFVGWHYGLKGYQRDRIMGVFYPERNALTVNYSVIQSKIAIGSAGLFGKGYRQGSQTQLGFLSEPENDFILSALIEEWGILAGLIVIGAFLMFIFRILKVGMYAQHNFEKFICLGAAMVLGIHFLLNAGSAIGIFPVVGVPFSFLSYGGSNLLMNFFLLGIINAIARSSR